MTRVVNIRKSELEKRGYRDFEHWLEDPNHVYIGRGMSFYVKGAIGSKWHNPFPTKDRGIEGCLNMYRSYVLKNPALINSLHELEGKELGCWCHPNPCHGDVLIELLRTRR